ncbi:large subunit ribosomal protein L4 [Nocardioides luteus]|uniref:Large ribosomal subunit protein uL4 n=1 Tax=Nocardioides luteus TaxID=1844 RepID=A0ABQ5SXM0_9ACTN|nr:50S ribosomal protein L4 [Nocardioides luteus]MDR7312126.1 large subunit ribosomal protein L4 [Nocardioides luteus]GGR56228.1 50S ribosomal protein L4 [Nocardioides luteus]GLJ68370.1 50S ribosomal protein L4 [Nocardioides luteus]
MAIKTVKVDFPAEIFDVELNIPLIHQVVVAQQAAARQGTHATKTRGEVRGGGRKPYKQKGTGRARQGSTRAPQFAGGGTVHGPQPRDYSQRTPKKMKAAALRGALSDRARAGQIHVAEFALEAPSTKAALSALKGLSDAKRFLVVLDRSESVAALSLRNAPEVHLLWADQLNTYDVLVSDDVVFSKAAYEVFVSGKAVATKETVTIGEVEKDAIKEPAAAPATETDLPEGAVAPLEDGSAPEGYDIKGNVKGKDKKFHAPGGRWYESTKAEFYFKSAEDAIAAGFVEAGKKKAEEADK